MDLQYCSVGEWWIQREKEKEKEKERLLRGNGKHEKGSFEEAPC